tara:strand:+ start:2268 stop:2768 length:501 start_codon:yes stop_codon:yes gene_type:complete
MTRTRKTAAETAADLRAKLEKAESVARMDEAKSNPTLAPIVSKIEEAKDNRTALSRKRSGPQSFDNRLRKHELWIAQIQAESDLNDSQTQALTEQIERLEYGLSELSSQLADGESLDSADVAVYANINAEEFPQFELIVEQSKSARINYNKKETVSFDMPENEAGA